MLSRHTTRSINSDGMMDEKRSECKNQNHDLLRESGWRFFDEKGKKANIILENQTKITQQLIDEYGNDLRRIQRLYRFSASG